MLLAPLNLQHVPKSNSFSYSVPFSGWTLKIGRWWAKVKSSLVQGQTTSHVSCPTARHQSETPKIFRGKVSYRNPSNDLQGINITHMILPLVEYFLSFQVLNSNNTYDYYEFSVSSGLIFWTSTRVLMECNQKSGDGMNDGARFWRKHDWRLDKFSFCRVIEIEGNR